MYDAASSLFLQRQSKNAERTTDCCRMDREGDSVSEHCYIHKEDAVSEKRGSIFSQKQTL